ncbi:MAG: DMT family transporter [Candidatus Latescibacterota bacterium]|nr:DMT family transporter [Candidatus Latescibacterota bacterium]
MIALVANVFFSIAFFHVIRSAQSKGHNVMLVALVNYLVASPVCFLLSYAQGNLSLSSDTLFWGTIQGVCFIGTYYLLCTSMSVSGMAIATAILRLSVVIPVLASVIAWGEIPTTFQVVGIIACVVSRPLIGLRQSGDLQPITGRFLFLMALLFVGMGIANTSSKAFVEAQVPDVQTTYIGVLFGVAAIGGFFCFLSPVWRRNITGWWDGMKLGLVNVVSIVTYLVALEELAGVVVFPIQAAAGLILNTLFAVGVWHERFSSKTMVGMAIAMFGLIFVNVD